MSFSVGRIRRFGTPRAPFKYLHTDTTQICFRHVVHGHCHDDKKCVYGAQGTTGSTYCRSLLFFLWVALLVFFFYQSW